MSKKVMIITDSTSDLKRITLLNEENERNLNEEKGVFVIPLGVTINDTLYEDGVNLTVEEEFELIEKYNSMPKTSTINPDLFKETFKKFIDEGYDCLYVGIGGHLSGTLNNAKVAALDFNEDSIFLVDSKSLSTGIGFLVLSACDLRDQGFSAKEIKDKLEELREKTVTQFGIHSLEFLHKGGRASGLTFFFGRLLRIKPILGMKDGYLGAKNKIVGDDKKVVLFQLDTLLEEYQKDLINTKYLFITHCYSDESVSLCVEYLKEKNISFENVYISRAGCVISSHCGKGTLGLIYNLK
ncbi:MAG: DegV family protein [Acholeplasmatales bacterium]|jgi:DegV family protein with EDD domain|nr:DegV family protein [Acholeplasmatales bacterium]